MTYKGVEVFLACGLYERGRCGLFALSSKIVALSIKPFRRRTAGNTLAFPFYCKPI